MASVFAKTLPSSLSARTLFVKCSPAPSSFTERRAVLKTLAAAGTDTNIEVFKRLEDSSSFIAVTTTPESARSLLSDSPYERIVHLQDAAKASLFSTAAWGASFRTTITDPVNVQPVEQWRRRGSKSTGTGDTTAEISMGLISKTFTIHVFPANASFNHKRAVELSPLHGPWPRNDGYDTFVSLALKKSIPGSRMSPGLRDWHTGRQLSQDPMGHEDEGAESLLGSKSRRSYFIERRIRKAENEIPDVMRSLAAVAKSSKTPSSSSSQESIAEQKGKLSHEPTLPNKSNWNDAQSVADDTNKRENSHKDMIKDKPISPSDFHDLFHGS
ncbi:hypothetical protein PFICI_07143 [Pestalotiopsis fici W106-1]|uniref:Uncharacterized protein n=1 Tax=Pestalotiopsis fici (strain W106-1 / CGMCC3.15140) TaxID=1229662 RepID=W3XAE8_PESFW|nr:uncharacterized protein PFICI_07143 [Pestalotiopsis fici W106-1]ETS82141.1 hypothetical protein PFICI_07143 [Pestalotiopsis fici W106-1]